MAVKNINNYIDGDGYGSPLNIRRGNPNPLDNSEIWPSAQSVAEYAANDPTAYVGQIISYFDSGGEIHAVQIINEQGKLRTLDNLGDVHIDEMKEVTKDEIVSMIDTIFK